MKSLSLFPRGALIVGVLLCGSVLTGCGGGGSSGGPATPTATPVAPTNISVTVQLRDTAGAPVEGLVTLDGQRRATTGGNATFLNVKAGALTASAEVNGATYSQNFVATSGANTVQIAINPAGGNPSGGEPPAPPY